MDYKDHHIEVSIRANSNGWVPDVYVSYSENGKSVLKSSRIDQTFALIRPLLVLKKRTKPV
jgi:hypothetical protein